MAVKWFLVLLFMLLIALVAVLFLSDRNHTKKTNLIPAPAKHMVIKDNFPETPFYHLKPNTTLESTLYGVCKRITNLANKGIAYIPTGSTTWPNYTGGEDQHGHLVIEVKPCD